MNVALGLLAAGVWARLIAHVIDYWDGISEDRREDFVAFYAASMQVKRGFASTIYDPQIIGGVEETVLGRTAGRVDGLAFMNPPFVAGAMQPLALVSFGVAQAIWFAVSAVMVAACIALLWPDLRRLRGRSAVMFAIAAVASYPVYMSMLYRQLSPLILLAWVLAYRLGVRGHAMLAGAALSLALIKPQFAVVPVLYLLVTSRWRMLAGFAIGALVLAASSAALAGPYVSFIGYPAYLLETLRWREEFGVNRLDMFGWHAFIIRSLPGFDPTIGLLLTAVLCALTLIAAIVIWRQPHRCDEMWAPALAIAAATILISPHSHTHDLLVLMLPAALLAGRRGDAVSMAGAALLLFAVPMGLVGVNIATPMLAAFLLAVFVQALRRRVASRPESAIPAAIPASIS
jgi:hypothetical protein